MSEDYQSEFQNWVDMWANAQDMEEFQSPAGNDYDTAAEIANPIDDPERSLYARMIGMDTGEEEHACSQDEELLQEQKKTPNPVYPDSIGPDCQRPKSAWVNEDLLKELEGLKDKLFKLENKMAELGVTKKEQKPVEMKFGEKMSSQMEQLRKQIDRISDNLGIKDEPSPWVIDEE
jgi:hypothetical protein